MSAKHRNSRKEASATPHAAGASTRDAGRSSAQAALDRLPSVTDEESDSREESTRTSARSLDIYGIAPVIREGQVSGRQIRLPMRRRRRSRRPLVIVAVLIVVALLAAGGICGWRLYQSAQSVRDEARAVLDVVDVLKDAVKEGNQDQLRRVASDVNVSAHNIAAEVSTPLWNAATHIPVYGEDIKSVQALSEVLVDLSDNALSPMVANSADALNLKSLLQDGTVNIEALRKVIAVLDEANPVLARSIERIESLPDAHLEQVQGILGKVKDRISVAGVALERLNAIVPYLPAMFGADGQTRNYLLVALNNAELRSIGGLPGSWSLLSVTDGHISLEGSVTIQGQPVDFLTFQPDELETLPGMLGNAAGISSLPNYARAAQLMAQTYTTYQGVPVNGTVAVDPVFLQRLLALGGGVTTSDGTVVDGSNAARVLLSDAYWKYGDNGPVQDAFFAEVAGLAFGQLMHGLGSIGIKDLFTTVFDSAEERRFQLWMADASEQSVMTELGLVTSLPTEESTPRVGVFLNDGTWSKISWYLRADTAIGEATANADGTKTYDVITTLTNTGSFDELARAPKYVSGYNTEKRDVADMLVLPLLTAPTGGSITNISLQGTGAFTEHTIYGLDAWFGNVHLGAGETASISYQVSVPATATEGLDVWQTALAQEFS